MTGRKIIVVGHRANSGRIVLWYSRMGVRYVEVDVREGPGGPVVMHGPPGTRRATPIGRLWAWLDYKLFYRDPLLRPQPLDRWLGLVSERLGVEGVLLDLKTPVSPDDLAMAVRRSGFSGKVMVSANDHRLLPPLRERLPGALLIASFSVRPVRIVDCALQSGAGGLGVRQDLLDRELVEEAHQRGLVVSTWTVNSVEEARRVAGIGVDIIISDRPDLVFRALGDEG